MTTYLITFRITTRDGSSNSYQQRRKEFDDLLASYAPKKFPLETDNNSSTSTYIIHEDEPDLGEISIQCISLLNYFFFMQQKNFLVARKSFCFNYLTLTLIFFVTVL